MSRSSRSPLRAARRLARGRSRLVRGLLTTTVAGGLGLVSLAGAATVPAEASPTTHPATHRLGHHPAHRAGRAFGSGTMGWRHRSATTGSAAPSSATVASPAASPAQTSYRSLAARAVVPTGIPGIDVASYQRTVNWTSYKLTGKQFAYVKATEGLTYKNPYFSGQYTGAYQAGMYHGAYHFAAPRSSSGAAQADFFVAHGGGWSRDGRTLPGVLDIEYNPYGGECYGLGKPAMVAWIKSFTTEYKRKTGRDAVIYSTTDWWTACTGNSAAFSSTNPLWIARYSSTAGTLPHNWRWYTFWQYSGTGVDQDVFNGTSLRLRALALG